jgi:hypothetical protein
MGPDSSNIDKTPSTLSTTSPSCFLPSFVLFQLSLHSFCSLHSFLIVVAMSDSLEYSSDEHLELAISPQIIDEDDLDLDVQLDVSAVPAEIISDDAPTQAQVIDGILRHVAPLRPTDDTDFYESSVQPISINTLKEIYNRRNKDRAIRMLHNRHRIVFSNDDLYDPKDPNLGWGQHRHFLDFLLVVPKHSGLDAIIPNREVDHNFSFDITFKQRAWAAKYGELGFNPSRRMLYIGKAGGQQVWLAMAPAIFFNKEMTNGPYKHDTIGKNPMVMPRPRFRRVIEMMSFMMKDMFGIHMPSFFTKHIDSNVPGAWDAHTTLL